MRGSVERPQGESFASITCRGYGLIVLGYVFIDIRRAALLAPCKACDYRFSIGAKSRCYEQSMQRMLDRMFGGLPLS